MPDNPKDMVVRLDVDFSRAVRSLQQLEQSFSKVTQRAKELEQISRRANTTIASGATAGQAAGAGMLGGLLARAGGGIAAAAGSLLAAIPIVATLKSTGAAQFTFTALGDIQDRISRGIDQYIFDLSGRNFNLESFERQRERQRRALAGETPEEFQRRIDRETRDLADSLKAIEAESEIRQRGLIGAEKAAAIEERYNQQLAAIRERSLAVMREQERVAKELERPDLREDEIQQLEQRRVLLGQINEALADQLRDLQRQKRLTDPLLQLEAEAARTRSLIRLAEGDRDRPNLQAQIRMEAALAGVDPDNAKVFELFEAQRDLQLMNLTRQLRQQEQLAMIIDETDRQIEQLRIDFGPGSPLEPVIEQLKRTRAAQTAGGLAQQFVGQLDQLFLSTAQLGEQAQLLVELNKDKLGKHYEQLLAAAKQVDELTIRAQADALSRATGGFSAATVRYSQPQVFDRISTHTREIRDEIIKLRRVIEGAQGLVFK